MLTCVGQRAEIVSAFRGTGATTVATDTSELAPALYKADVAALTPRFDDGTYIPVLRSLIAEYQVDVVLPLTDLDQLLLTQNCDTLGALVLLPPPEVVLRSNDKLLCHKFLREAGVGSPDTWHPSELAGQAPFPVFIKLRFGSGSKHIRTAHDEKELRFYLDEVEGEALVQELCQGEEYSIDVFSDLEGRCINAIPRTMLQSKAGETVKGTTIRDDELTRLGQTVAERFGVVGPATIQCFREKDKRLLVTDINLRFGGGFPLPTAAGSRYPEYVLALARGEPLKPCMGVFEVGLSFAAYPSQVILQQTETGLTDVTVARLR